MRVFTDSTGRKFASFLELVKEQDLRSNDLDPDSVLLFLNFGTCYFSETLCRGVTKEFTHQHTEYYRPGMAEPLTVSSASIKEPAAAFRSRLRENLSQLYSEKISVDVTGGIDSRLLIAALSHLKIPFSGLYSMYSGTEKEAEIAAQVAETAGFELKIISRQDPDPKVMDELFLMSDGLWDMMSLRSLRAAQKWRSENGFSLALTGAGGELYKDFWWQQDFPFYTRKKADIVKLAATRMYGASLPEHWFRGDFESAASNCLNTLVNRLKKYADTFYNTQAYDRIYYHVRIKEQLSLLSSAAARHIEVYSPLIDDRLLKIGYNLKRRKRFFNRFHRTLISFYNEDLSRLPTTDAGMTVSDQLADEVVDLFKYATSKSIRLLNRRNRSKTESYSSLITDNYRQSVKDLREIGLFSDGFPVKISAVSPAVAGRVITLGRLIHYLDSDNQ